MVLDNAAAPADSFPDTVPSSDVDPYATSNPDFTATRTPSFIPINPPGQNQIYINTNSLPRRWSLLGQKEHPQALIEGVKESCKFASNVLNRPLKQEEADAFAYHFAKSLRMGSYGTPVGAMLGGIQSYRTRSTYRFPLWSPFKEGGRLSADAFGPFKGDMARAAWHSMRISSYITVGAVLGQVFFGSYAISVGMAGRTMDPRLKDFVQALRRRMENGTLEAAKQGNAPAPGAEKAPERVFPQSKDNAREAWRRNRQAPAPARQSADDDMSPTGGAYEAEFSGASSDTGLLSDSQMQDQEVQQRADQRRSPAENTATTFDMDKVTSQPRGFDQDDASPTAPARQQPPRKQPGSAWERIRQEAAAGQQQGPSGPRSAADGGQPSTKSEQRDGSTLGDSFSFSESDEEKQLARSEAQKEFDSRVEREREGRDFEEGRSSRRRW